MDNLIKNKITFFSPYMMRTGSEIVLLNLLNHINKEYKIRVVSKYKGELLNKIQNNISTEFLYRYLSLNIIKRILNKFKSILYIPYKLNKYKDSIWYVNTIALPDIIKHAKENKIKTIVHVHELEQMFNLLSVSALENLINYPDLIIANSKATERVLNKYGRTKKIKICYPAIDTSSIIKNKKSYTLFRKKLNIPSNKFVWAMCGTLDENKNPFLFIDVADEILKTHPLTSFIWIGGGKNTSLEISCKQKSAEKGLSEKIIWITHPGDDYLNYFNTADGFFLTSKKESFSLVTLEALLLELPVVANDCDGVREVLQDSTGKIVAGENVKKMAMEMIDYMDKKNIHDVEKGKQIAYQFDIGLVEKQWNEILTTYFKQNQ